MTPMSTSSAAASSASIPHVVLDALGAQSTALGLGVTTALLLFTTCIYHYLSRTRSSSSTSSKNGSGNASRIGEGGDGDIDVLDETVSYTRWGFVFFCFRFACNPFTLSMWGEEGQGGGSNLMYALSVYWIRVTSNIPPPVPSNSILFSFFVHPVSFHSSLT